MRRFLLKWKTECDVWLKNKSRFNTWNNKEAKQFLTRDGAAQFLLAHPEKLDKYSIEETWICQEHIHCSCHKFIKGPSWL